MSARVDSATGARLRVLAARVLERRPSPDLRPGARLRAIGAATLEAKLKIDAHESVIRDALATFTWYELEARGVVTHWRALPRTAAQVIATWESFGVVVP